MYSIKIKNDAAMRELGKSIADGCPHPCVIYLVGELGAGKSTLARGFLRALGHQGAVRSPTYTLVEHYELSGLQVYHLDLYRLADPDELDFLGFRDWLGQDCILLIEWPENGEGVLPAADLVIQIDYAGTARDVDLQNVSESGAQITAQLVKISNNEG